MLVVGIHHYAENKDQITCAQIASLLWARTGQRKKKRINQRL